MQRAGYLLILIAAAYVLHPCTLLHAQKTNIYTHEDLDFKTGLDLFEKEKFGPAQHYFENIIRKTGAKNSLVRMDAEYYAALCAVELFNKDAEELLASFIYSYPESPRVKMACFHMGRYKYRKKQYPDAIAWFEKVDPYELDKEELEEFHFKRGYSYFEQQQFEKAAADFYEIKDVDNKYAAPAAFYYSHIEYSNKNYETALKGFQKLIADQNFSVVVPYYIVHIMYLQGKYDQVITYAPTVLRDTSNAKRIPEIEKIIGESYYRTGSYADAIVYFEKYKDHAGSMDRSDWYAMGYANYKTGDYNKSIASFKNAVNAADSIAQNAFYHMGDCYLQKGDKHQALDAFYNAFKINADNGVREDALFNYAKLSYELSYNPFSEAIRAFEQYLKEYPNSARNDETYGFLVDVYFTTKNYEAAFASISKIKSLTPDLKTAYQKIAYQRAVQLFNDNEFPDAIVYFDKSLQYPADKNYNALAKYWKADAYYRHAENNRDINDLEAAIKNYKDFLFEPGAIDQPVFNMVNYSLGYAYFKEKKYADANSWFRKFTRSKTNESPEKMNDAFLRIADGFFVMRDYANAVDYYNKVLEIKANDVDYALYQKANMLGLMKKYDAKINVLKELLGSFAGKTIYEPAAEYELALTYSMTGDNDNAYIYFTKVLSDHPNSIFAANSMLQLGNIQNKRGQYDAAMGTLNMVLNKYPKTDISMEAVNIMREVCKKKGDADCLDKLKELGYGSITISRLDSDNYEIAKNYYFDGKYDEAYKAFSKYQQKFADGAFITDTYFYKGEIDFKNNNLPVALGEYNYVVDKPRCKYTETALAKAAWIDYKTNSFDLALGLYTKLEAIAESPGNMLDAKTGQMRCNFNLARYDDAVVAANKVLALPKLSNELKTEAHLVIARSALQKQDYETASKEFGQVLTLSQNEKSAEAKYNIAFIQYTKGQYKESQKSIFELINQKPGYPNWIGKGFLLLSDDYLSLNDRYNARYTLKTFIDKSSNAELVEEAKKKLAGILEAEKAEEENQKKKKEEEFNIQFKSGNGRDSMLFNNIPGRENK